MFAVLITIIIILLIGYAVKTTKKPPKYPPGPQWMPFLGCSGVVQRLSKLHGSQWKGLLELSKEYSTEILGLNLGGELVVVVYGARNVKQVFTSPEFEGRPDSFFLRLRCFGKRIGITFSDGLLWREHRNFTVRQLRNVGFGKTKMEAEIQNGLNNILEYIDKYRDKPINVKNILPLTVMHILWAFVAGERIEEERLKHLINLLNDRSKAFSMAGGWLNMFPWCRFIIPKLSGYSLIKNMNQEISNIIEEAINKHKSNSVQGNDFIYAFLEEIKDNKNTYTEEQLKGICLDLLIAGSQTTSNVLEFAILVLLRNKRLQDRIYEEIITIGDDVPSWNHTQSLPYTSAFLLEVQRYYTIVPLAGPRRVLNDTIIDGYCIPKETTVLISLGDLHFSPEIWEEPKTFNPDRFINEEGTLKTVDCLYPFGLDIKTLLWNLWQLIQSAPGHETSKRFLQKPLLQNQTTISNFLTVSVGRRRCPGDSLAKSFIFIVLVGILQKYRIECTNGALPSDEPNIGLIAAPKPYTAVFVPRN